MMTSLAKERKPGENRSETADRRPKVHKIVVLGEGGVGKSAITLQFVSNIFMDIHDPTIEDAYQSQIVVDDKACILDILDTAGQSNIGTDGTRRVERYARICRKEEFAAMREQYMRHGEGFIFVYSVTDFNSFHMLTKHLKTLERVRDFEPVPLVLVGNKTDLEQKRQVSHNEGAALANEMDCAFLETSARARKNIEETFYSIIREIRRREKSGIDPANLEKKKGLLNRVRKYLKNIIIKSQS